MKTIQTRIERLEAQSNQAGPWFAPIVNESDYASKADLNTHLEQIRREALAAGWRPEQGVYVIVISGVSNHENDTEQA